MNDAPYIVEWYVPDRVIYAHVSRQLEGQESAEVDSYLTALIREATPPVFLIMDLRRIDEMQHPSVSRLNTVGYRQEPNLSWIVYVANDKLMRFLASTAAQQAGKQYHHVNTMDEALIFVQKQAQYVNWTSARDQVIVT